MSLTTSGAEWPPPVPPEIPPHRPMPPWQPDHPGPTPPPPILPSWEEVDTTSPEDDITERLLQQRIVHLGGHLDTTLANRTAGRLLLLDRLDDSPIELHLTCPGSELDASMALAGTVEVVSADVHVIVHGTVSGPAVAVLCSGRSRTAHRGATLVLSLPRAQAEGSADELAAHARQHERQVAALRDLVAGVTGRDSDDVDADLRSGRVLSADEALEYGLLDRVL